VPTLEIYAEMGGDGGCLLFTFDPPGLLARGASYEEALASAPDEAARLRDLLTEAGLLHLFGRVGPGEAAEAPSALAEKSGDIDLVVAETVRGSYRVGNGDTRATFQRDLVPVEAGEVPGFLAVLALIRSGFLTLRDRIPPGAYGFRSAPHRWTIEEQIRHVASCDHWYLDRKSVV